MQERHQPPAVQPPAPQSDWVARVHAEQAAKQADKTAHKQALRAEVFRLRRGWVDALQAKGIEVKPAILMTSSTDTLVATLADNTVSVEKVDEVMGRFVESVLEARVTALSSWHRTLVEDALTLPIRPADNPEFWQPLRQAAEALIAGLEAIGVTVDRERLTSDWELRSLASRMQDHRDPAAIQLVVDAFAEYVVVSEVAQWRNVHQPFTATKHARKQLAKGVSA